jgi:hypothetical protein
MKTKLELFDCHQTRSGNWAALVGYRGEKDAAILIKGVAFQPTRNAAIKRAIKSFRTREQNA